MLKIYLKIIFRNLLKHRIFSLINILGLAFGIASCLIIYLYVSYEESYDTFNENAASIYRLKNVRYYASGTDSSAGCVALLGPTLQQEIPEVINFSRVKRKNAVVTVNNRAFNEGNMFWADSSFLTMFSYSLVAGNSQKALTQKQSAVLTESIARKYFGEKNPMGETIELDGMKFNISGILKDIPANSHIRFDILLSFVTQLSNDYCWACNNNNTYIQVSSGTKKVMLEAKLPQVVNKLHGDQENGFERAYFLQPLEDIHLNSNLRFEHQENGNARVVYFLSLIAIAILLIAWINYINLSTARSLERAREIGLRKVIGAGSATLIRQFLLESFIINLIAVALAIIIVQITHPYWKELIDVPVSVSLWTNPDSILLFIFLIIINPLIAGFYPAVVLSSYAPASILRGSFKSSQHGILLRKGLIIFQFAVTIILLVAITVFKQQLSFMMNTDLGLNIEKKLVINAPARLDPGSDPALAYDTFLNDLYTRQLIDNATLSSVIPGMENSDVSGGVRQERQPNSEGKQAYFVYIAENFLDFFKADLISGRNFLPGEVRAMYSRWRGPGALIINKSACDAFGFFSTDQALGASIIHDNVRIGHVVGVIKDYHQQSLDREIKPTIFLGSNIGNYFIVDMNFEHLADKMEAIKNRFTAHFPANPFEFRFLDDFFDKQYKNDMRTAEILTLFTILSVFISCLGLVGLSSLIMLQRTKEIGVRKVLGATITGIVHLLSKDFIKLVMFANLLAWPLAWYFMEQWLQNFSYRIEMGVIPYLLAAILALFFTLLTLSWQAVRAAKANPVEALRYE